MIQWNYQLTKLNWLACEQGRVLPFNRYLFWNVPLGPENLPGLFEKRATDPGISRTLSLCRPFDPSCRKGYVLSWVDPFQTLFIKSYKTRRSPHNGEFSQPRCRRPRERQNPTGFMCKITALARATHFGTFLCCQYPTTKWNCLILRSMTFVEDQNEGQRLFPSLIYLECGL